MSRTQEQIDQMDKRLARIRRRCAADFACLYARDSESGQFEPARGRFVDEDDLLIGLRANGDRDALGTVRQVETDQSDRIQNRIAVGVVGAGALFVTLNLLIHACA